MARPCRNFAGFLSFDVAGSSVIASGKSMRVAQCFDKDAVLLPQNQRTRVRDASVEIMVSSPNMPAARQRLRQSSFKYPSKDGNLPNTLSLVQQIS